jgi:opacity protein-like surface antigen
LKRSIYALGIIGLAALSSNANADSGFYLGGGGMSGSGTFENSYLGSTTDNDTSGSAFKLGYITAGGNRLELSFGSIDLESPTVNGEVSGVDFDFLWTFGTGQMKPYLGVGFGSYTFKDSARYFTDNKDLKGVALNLSAGLVYEVVSNVELEAALRLKSIESQEFQGAYGTGTWNQTMTNIYFGANLKF